MIITFLDFMCIIMTSSNSLGIGKCNKYKVIKDLDPD